MVIIIIIIAHGVDLKHDPTRPKVYPPREGRYVNNNNNMTGETPWGDPPKQQHRNRVWGFKALDPPLENGQQHGSHIAGGDGGFPASASSTTPRPEGGDGGPQGALCASVRVYVNCSLDSHLQQALRG